MNTGQPFCLVPTLMPWTQVMQVTQVTDYSARTTGKLRLGLSSIWPFAMNIIWGQWWLLTLYRSPIPHMEQLPTFVLPTLVM